MGLSEKPPANGFVRYARKVYNPLGFQKGYNFVLFFIFGGAFLAFALARFMYLDIPGVYCGKLNPGESASPGECLYYNTYKYHYERIGIRLHLYCIIPAAFLSVWQFLPVIRHKAILFHRLNGYLTMILALIGSIGGVMMARRAFGGTIDTQTGTGALFIMTTGALIMAYVNIKRLQIDQHRAWMLRAWFYFGVIITVRLTMYPLASILSKLGGYYTVQPCDKLGYILINPVGLRNLYPACAGYVNGTDPDGVALVKVNYYAYDPAQIASALGIGFGTCIWLAILIHAVGVEIYLHLTPREAERLRNVSYQRQLEAGYKHPGNGGLTVQRLGDADPWEPSSGVEPKNDTLSSSSDEETEVKPYHMRPEAKTVNSDDTIE